LPFKTEQQREFLCSNKYKEEKRMKNNVKRYLAVVMGLIMITSVSVIPARADQPFMRAALLNVRKGNSYLQKANADKGGFRVKAMELADKAIIAINNGIAWDQQHPGNRRRNSEDERQIFGETQMKQADNANMFKARAELEAALANLGKASADKGGYRNDAMNHVRSAIQAINDGIEYDRTH
jgi:hypothetical protein